MSDLIRSGLVRLRAALGVIKMTVSRALAFLRIRRNFIRRRIEGEDDLEHARKIAVFVHWDRDGRVHRYVQHYLESLREAGFAILFVTNSPKLDEGAIERLLPLVGRILWRRNVGYDFGAYKDGILELGNLSRLDALAIANDSVYGPFFPMDEVLEEAHPERADVFSITDSWERRFHLQSYFMLFHSAALANPGFTEFWRKLAYVDNKHYVVAKYEVGLSKVLLAQGLRCVALYPYETAAREILGRVKRLAPDDAALKSLPDGERRMISFLRDSLTAGNPINGSHFFWDHMLVSMRCPFIKRELLAHNPMRVPGLIYWREALARVSDYDPEFILEHLRVVRRGRVS